MALTRLDNLISSKTGKYLYVSPDDFNASDELNNRGNSPIRPFKSIQRAFIEIARYSYQPGGPDNDRFDQFTVMVMPGKHYVDNRPGIISTDGIDSFTFDQALGEWADSSNLDISDPNNKLYLFNNTEGGAIIPRGSSIIGYDLRRTSVYPLFVPDPADRLEKRSAIFNVTGGCYFWQFTIRDGDLEPSSPLYDTAKGVGKVYYQNGNWDQLATPNFSHHKLTVFEYADKEELSLYYSKVAKAFAQYQPTIDDANEFGDRIEETRIVGPLSDIRSIESIKLTDSSPAQTITVEVTTKVQHGYLQNQFIAIENNGLDDAINGTFQISDVSILTNGVIDKRKFSYTIPGTVSALGTVANLVNNQIYDASNGLNPNAVVKAEVDTVESASPYVFNCSIRSTWGICGIWANGLKATGFKSMVIAQYTGVSLQKDDRAFIRYDEFTNTFNQASLTDAFATVPYHTKGDAFWKDDWRNFHVRASEDAFIQCVSIFAVGYADHFLMESGGDMSITNSNSNFGNTSLHAKGHKGYSFNQDKGGYITDIVPPQQVEETVGNTTKQSYYTLDVYASNDANNHTKVYHGDDEAIDPTKRVAATIGGYRIGAKTDDKLKVKLQPRTAGADNEFFSTISPSGFKKFTAAADILNPSGVTINNQTLDAADLIEANKEFIAHESYDRILGKYPTLKTKESITIEKCRRDVGYLLDATVQDLRLGGNVNTIQAAESYFVATQLSYINNELTETLEGYNYARDLAIAATRNFTYLRKGTSTTLNNAIVNIGDTSGVVEGMTVADYDPSQFTSDNKLIGGASRPTTPVIPNNTFVKRVIDSTSIELGDNTQTAEKKVQTDRHGNARELILANKTFIATEAYERMLLDYPGYTPSSGYTAATGKTKCIDDLSKAIDAIAANVGYGGNAETWDAAYFYESGSVVDLAAKKQETLTAFNYCKDMSIQVMRKEPVFIYGTHGLTQSSITASDPITNDPSPELVSNRNGDAHDLIEANKNLIAAEAVERMILKSSSQKFTPSGATYDPETGEMVITSTAHGLTAATTHTATGASYTPADGVLELTIANHGFTNGQKVLIKDGSLSLKCAMDSNATIHSYPRPTDPYSGKWLTIANKTNNTFEVNVGASPQVTYTPVSGTTYNPTTGLMTLKIGNHNLRGSTSHTPTNAAYNPTTGVVTLTIANHGFTTGDKVKLNDNALTFTCAEDSNGSNHTYPRSSDPISGKWQEITNVTKDTFDIQVLSSTPSTNVTAHTFISAATNGLIKAGESIRLAANSLKFSCGFGGATGTAAEKTYPRSSDPFYNTAIPIESATVDTITIQVLTTIPSTNTDAHTFVSATPGAVETGGAYTHTFHAAGTNGILAETDSVRIDYDALTFTCDMDGHTTQHTYPRISDPAANKILPLVSKTNDTFTINVGKSLDKKHDVTDATYNTSTGDLQLTLNNHNLVEGQSIRIADDSLTFTCSQDGNTAQKTYPRNDITTHTATDAAYNPTSGIVTLTVAAHGFENGDKIQVVNDSLTFTCLEDSNATNKTYPRASDPISGKSMPISNVTTNTFDIQVLSITPSTNTTAHTFVSAAANGIIRRKDLAYQNSLKITKVGSSFHTATNASYTPKTGILELTIPSHGLSAGSRVKISKDSLTFKCAMDNYATEHVYPRTSDPSYNKWLEVSDVTPNTFKVNVGVAGADQEYTPVDGTYDPASGDLVLTIGNHNLAKGDGVVIDNESLSFTCSMDNNQVAQSYPRAGVDKASSRSLDITAKTDTTITVNVGAAGTSKTFTPSTASYDANTGDMILTVGQHGIAVGSDVTLKDNSLVFSCSKDSNTTQHSYPRPNTDPYATKSIRVDKVGSTKHTVTGAVYTPSTGKIVVSIAGHGFSNNDYVKFADNSLTFTCSLDGNSVQKSYPRNDFDQTSGKWLQITNKTNDTFEVNVGSSTDDSTHTFISATANGLERQDGTLTINVSASEATTFTPSAATYNPTDGKMVLTLGTGHGLSNGSKIRIAKESLKFTCAEDSNTATKLYPRASDPVYNTPVAVSEVTADTVTVQVLSTQPSTNTTAHVFTGVNNQLTATGAAYDAKTGIMTLTVTGHGMIAGERVKIADDSITLTCAMDGHFSQKTYPRSTDPVSGKWLPISNITADTFDVHVGKSPLVSHTPSAAAYDPATGLMELTIGAHSYVIGDNVKIAEESLIFTCAQDNNATEHAYPRAATTSHTPSTAAYNPTTGVMTLTVAGHGFENNDWVKLADGAVTFTCAEDSNGSNHSYPRASDPISKKFVQISNVTTNTFDIQVLANQPSTNTTAHTFVSAVANSITKKTDPYYDSAYQVTGVTGTTITVQVLATPPSSNTTAHTFVNALTNAVTAGGDYAHTYVGASANGITRSVVLAGDQYDHTFISATTDAVEYSPQSPHTWVSAKTSCVKHYPDQAHQFVRAGSNGIQKQGGTITVNVGASGPGDQYAHTFISATSGAVTSGGNYAHTFVKAGTDSVHKTFSIAGNRTYHGQDCIDDVRDLLEAIADNVAYGGNDKTWDAAYSYKTGAHVAGEETETNEVFRHAKEMAGQVIKNQKILSIGSHGLTQTYDTDITFDPTQNAIPEGKFGDAYNLLIANADIIAHEAYNRMKLNHPNFLPPTGNKQDCIDDIKDFVVEVAHNVGFGGNDRVWDMAQLYVTGAHVAGEETQTIEAFQDATQLMIQAMRNEKILVTGSHGKTQTFDTTITASSNPAQNNKVADGFNLITTNKNFLADVAMARMIGQFPSYQPPTGYTQNDCKDDLKDIVDVIAHNLRHGGNDRVWDASNLYVAGNASGSVNETVYAVEQLRDMMIEVIRNETVTVTSGQTNLSQAKDLTITADTANPKCQTEAATIVTLATILTNTISTHSSLASVTRTPSVYKCSTVESTINTLSTVVQNAITTPASLSGTKASVSGAAYNPTTGVMELTVGAHGYKVGEPVSIPNESLVFTCAQDSNGTQHKYPRATDPMGKASSNITAVTATTISVQVLPSIPSTNTTAHTFVSSTDDIIVGGVKRAVSAGRCENIRTTIDTLFKIVTDTITTPASLNSVTRNISNGKCQNVASTISTLYKLITDTINSQGNLSAVDRTPSPTGLSTGNAVNANASTTNTYIYFTLPAGRYTSAYSPTPDNTITQDTNYPQCNTVADTVRQYFANISTIIQTGVGTVTRNQPSSSSSNLSSRATVFTLKDWTPGVIAGSNPHQLETGTAVRLVPRPRYDRTTTQYVTVDKRNVRLPNGFETNTKYYVIAPGRTTQPENYAGTTTFNGTDQTKLMLASSKENAAAGIYIHSAEVDAIDSDVEIDIYQFVLDDKYDLHQYKCVLDTTVQGGIKTDVPNIFDVPTAIVEPQKVFFRKNENGSLPTISTNQQSDTDITDTVTGKIRNDKFFYSRYQSAKVFTVHKTHAEAIANTNEIVFQNVAHDFSVFADKRESPLRYDPTYDKNIGTTAKGKWYIQVKNESQTGTQHYNSQTILSRFHDSTYSDQSGNNKTNDSWFERLKDERPANDRIFRLRYVIPKYLKSVRDPLNGFTIKMRKDETRKLLPQRLMLKPVVSGGVTQAKFYNTPDSGQSTEIIGYTQANFDDQNLNLDITKQYDPYKRDTSGGNNYTKNITTSNTYIDLTIESAKFITSGSDTFTEITVVNPRIENVGLKNEVFTTVKITAPQGGSFAVNSTQNVAGNAVTWSGNSTGSGFIHAALQVPNTTTWHLILKGVTGDIKYSATDNIRFTQGTVFADLLGYPDSGKSLVLKDLIKENFPQYYYRQNGAKVSTVTPGDIITDDANVQFYVESVEDIGEIDDTFYIFNVEEIQRRIFDQQDGIFYLTAIRGNISPYPLGAGNQKNFHDFKFSQPISKLYPLNYKNDPVWFKQIDTDYVDPPATYSAADNYVHGLVRVNDFKDSLTKESVIDMLATEALKNNTYTDVTGPKDNRLRAQTGNASSGSEDRLIPISGDSTTISQQRLYVELRRPSIARAGNHTFEYLGFGPGNYSTGFPARQEVLLSTIQDFYAQSKKQNGGLVFYTGLNSNGDLYIGNRKIDAITGEEEFLERAALVDSEDEDDAVGDLVTTFDTPVTFNEYITVNGGENNDKTSTFNSPVTINVNGEVRDTTLGVPGQGVLTSLKISSLVSNTKDDVTLDRTNQAKNRQTNGDILIAGNKITASIFQWNQRGNDGAGQGYKIQTHCVTGNIASNITPDQAATFNALQTVSYGAGGGPRSGDILLKGDSVGRSGSWGWILANAYITATTNALKFTYDGTNLVTLTWKTGVTNATAVTGGVVPGQEIKISGWADPKLNGVWIVNAGLTSSGNTLQFNVSPNDALTPGDRLFSAEPNAVLSLASSGWKELGVLGAETIRTDTQTIGQYKLGVNTVARTDHSDYATAFVAAETDPRANLDVVGTAFISGKTVESYGSQTTWIGRTETNQDHAFMVGGDSRTGTDPGTTDPYQDNAATFRVSTTNNGRVGINTTKGEMQSAFTTKGTSEFTDNAVFQKDINVNGGGPGSSNTADIKTSITDGTATLFNDTGFVGLTSGTRPTQGLKIGGSARNIEIGDVATASQNIKIGNLSTDSIITIGDTPDGASSTSQGSQVHLGGNIKNNEDYSYTHVGSRSLRVDGDVWIGYRYNDTAIQPDNTVSLKSNATSVSFFSNSGGPSTINFGLNASEVNIAGQGGKTTINNQLEVAAAAEFKGDVKICGGLVSFSFTGDRGQLGSTIVAHADGITAPYSATNPNKNVDIVSVYVKQNTEADYNQIDTAGAGVWGTLAAFQTAPTNTSFPALTGDEYYLPLKNAPGTYFSLQDYLIVDTGINSSPVRHPEIFQVTGLTSTTTSPYYLKVKKQPLGTFTGTLGNHPDTTPVYKVNIQFDSTWTEQALDNTGPQDLVDLAEFGGSLTTNDYVIVDRDPTDPTKGEVIGVATLVDQQVQRFVITDCGNPEKEVFIVNSVTGDTTITGATTINNSLTLNGGCEKTSEAFTGSIAANDALSITGISAVEVAKINVGDYIKLTSFADGHPIVVQPSVKVVEKEATSIKLSRAIGNIAAANNVGFKAVTNEVFAINDGNEQSSFHLDTCNSTLELGNHYRRIQVQRALPTPESATDTVTAYSAAKDNIRVYSYWLDPTHLATTGGRAFLTSIAATGQIAGSVYLTLSQLGTGDGAFAVGDIVMVGKKADIDGYGDNTNGWETPTTTPPVQPVLEIMTIQSIDALTKVVRCLPGQEGTTARALTDYPAGSDINDAAGTHVVKLRKHPETSEIYDIALRQRTISGVTTDYVSLILKRGYVVQTKLDYMNWVRFHDTTGTISDQYFLVNDSLFGSYHQTTMNEYLSKGLLPYQKGTLKVNKDFHMIGGDVTIYDSVRSTKILSVNNDDGHADHAGTITFEAGIIGRGAITLYPTSCPESNIACDVAFSVDVNRNVVAGSTLTVNGEALQAPAANPKFKIDNLGINGARTFEINQDSSIDAFGVENFYNINGGRHARYIATGADDADKFLTANLQYFVNVSNGDTFVVYLPQNPVSGDAVHIIDVGGNLTYNTSLVVRAQGTGTRVQGDSSGTTLGLAGSTPYAAGEMIVQTPNAGFTLVYLGGTDSNGNSVGASVAGWWLKEV